ncbi:Pentatricopeptide repeat-containing protein [Nymphaea thermarum]|nr:Pentatricopeptide repeat-containing protein [Nymphaea thermarum]
MVVNGVKQPSYLYSKLILFYSQCGRIPDARKVFEKMPKRNLQSWVVLLGAYARYGYWQGTLELFDRMLEEGFAPNKYVFPSALRACANLSDLETGKRIHALVRNSRFDTDVFVDSALVDMYAKCGCLESARRVFDMMSERDLVSWNTMVSSYSQCGMVEEALKLVRAMRNSGIKPDSVTWNAVIVGFSQMGNVVMALMSFRDMQADGIKPDVVSWTAMVSGFAQNHLNEEAFGMFHRMLLSGFMPSSVTISGLLPACANLENLKHGKEIHGYSLIIGVAEEVFVSSSLVDVYGKCGFVSEARKVFDRMPKRNTVSWNSMIYGYAMHGHGIDALRLFDQMQSEGVIPDHITYTIVLTACSHGGFVDQGRAYFENMQLKHGIEPRVEHYAAIVDLLGRAGMLLEAYAFVNTMPMKPDFYVWGALLGACRIHGNVELAEIAASHLFELEPGGSGSYILLSNILAEAAKGYTKNQH